MVIDQSGFERLVIKEDRAEVVITPDRENHGKWFVDHTRDIGKVRPKRIILSSKELRAAVGIIDHRVKVFSYVPEKFLRNKHSVIISPEKDETEMPINPKVQRAIRRLVASTERVVY